MLWILGAALSADTVALIKPEFIVPCGKEAVKVCNLTAVRRCSGAINGYILR